MAVTRGTSRPRRALAASRLLLRTICPSKYSPVQGRKGVPGPAASGQGRGHAEGSPEKSVFSSGSSWTAASGAGDSDRERALPPPQRLAWVSSADRAGPSAGRPGAGGARSVSSAALRGECLFVRTNFHSPEPLRLFC
ncbi:dexamethasone-induced protein isoform X1 [Heliangelus exortis]|uniref:dexamethasone-induced protein isoform X1 n=1 Tax=Heliangelus exortis TaxID=472823 RepID=UPI003A94BFC4